MTEKSEDKFSIRLRAAGMSETNGEIIAQGFLDLEAIDQLKVDDYQREVLKAVGERASRKTKLEKAVELGNRMTPIVLGMRGQRFRSSGSDLILYDTLYIVDGLQRVFAIKNVAQNNPEKAKSLLLGAEIRFDTTKETEKELFQTLNTRRTPMSPNVILRNMRDSNKAVLTIYGLSNSDHTSVLFDRVQWSQRMNRGHLFTGLIVVRVAEALHKHIQLPIKRDENNIVKYAGSNSGDRAASLLDRRASKIGLKTFRENISEFFELLDEAFGIRNIEIGVKSAYLRGNFMNTLAKLMSDHEDFWNGNRLVVNAAQKRRIASFPIDDPEVIRLAGAGNTAAPILYNLLLDHMNKGMKKNRLTPRKVQATELEYDE